MEDKDRINAGLEDGRFFLATGGDTKTSLRCGQRLSCRPATGRGRKYRTSR